MLLMSKSWMDLNGFGVDEEKKYFVCSYICLKLLRDKMCNE